MHSTFVHAKQKNVTAEQMAQGAGDVWTWTAIDADNKLIISYTLGDRGADTAHAFMQDVASRTRNRIQLTTDGHRVYAFWGRYQPDPKQCQKCGHYAYHPQEKKTDVNIATQLLCDAFHEEFDTALIVSGDADLVPPVQAVRTLFPKKRVVIAFPPKRYSSELAREAHGYFNIFEAKLRQSLLPPTIKLASGVQLACPTKWR
jgi:uncharacterized LabA/DUF88 family protein